MALDSSLAAVFIMFLLSWDLYVCPQTLAIVSACLRSGAFIRIMVLLCWFKLCFCSPAVEHLIMEGENQKRKEMSIKRSLLYLLWCVLVVVLSAPAIFYQVVNSIPGSFHIGYILLLGTRAAIGAIQGLVGNFIVPNLASKLTLHKHVFTAVSSLVMNCLIPAILIIYLDIGCLARWVILWKPCRRNSQLLERHLVCTEENGQDCKDMGLRRTFNMDVMVLRSNDLCEPHFSWSSTSISRCIQISLLRLQEIWLTKFITTGLVMPGLDLVRGVLPTESGQIVGNFGIYVAYALVSSGHLPLMNFVLLLACLGEGLVARVAWVEKCLKPTYVKDVAAPVVKMARLLSLVVHLASVAGDAHMSVVEGACIFALMATSISTRLARAHTPGGRLGGQEGGSCWWDALVSITPCRLRLCWSEDRHEKERKNALWLLPLADANSPVDWHSFQTRDVALKSPRASLHEGYSGLSVGT